MRHQRDGLAHPSGGVNLTMPLKSMPYRSGRRSGRGFWSGRKLPGGPQAPGRPTSSRAAHRKRLILCTAIACIRYQSFFRRHEVTAAVRRLVAVTRLPAFELRPEWHNPGARRNFET